MIWLVALVLFHGPGGFFVLINPDEVASVRSPQGDESHMPKGTKCVLNTTDGKFTPVVEDCPEVERRLLDAK